MPVAEILDKERIHALLSDDPLETLEALDENALGVPGIVSVFAPDGEWPVNMMAIRWGQKPLGLGSLGLLRAGRVSGLEDLVGAVPIDRGEYDLLVPFWASAAVSGAFQAEVAGVQAIYVVDRRHLGASSVVRQTVRLDDVDVIRPMFPKLAEDAPAYVLSLRDQLVSVAAVTHLREEVARVSVYTVESSRGHGFGRGVLTALTDELIALGVVPSVAIDLGREPEVRMVEGAGFRQTHAFIKARILGRRDPHPDAVNARVVRIGGR